MPKTRISEYSVTNSSNTDIEGINIDEGCAPSGINNAIRELMVHLKEFQTGASGDAFTFAGGVLISGTANTITGNVLMSGTNTITGSTTATFAAGAVGTPSIAAHGDTNTGIFFPAADTIAFAEGGAEAMRIDSSGNVGIGTTSPARQLNISGPGSSGTQVQINGTSASAGIKFVPASGDNWEVQADTGSSFAIYNRTDEAYRMVIDSSGNVGIGSTTARGRLTVSDGDVNTAGEAVYQAYIVGTARTPSTDATGMLTIQSTNAMAANTGGSIAFGGRAITSSASGANWAFISGLKENGTSSNYGGYLSFATRDTVGGGTTAERARITSSGDFQIGKTATNFSAAGVSLRAGADSQFVTDGNNVIALNRLTNDGNLMEFAQAGTTEGTISVSGNTVSYNGFSGGHWTQLQQGRGYNPDILRGTVMSSIGEMCEWKSVVWDETIEHPAVPAVEAKEAVLDEEGNVIEPAVEAVEGKDAWTETIPHREAYLGNLAIGATFEEDGVTKTVVDDGNERLPKVKISDVVGDKAVYGVFQTWDEVQDMLVTSLGAFVVRIAAGITVQIGDLLESNGDGCAKVQDDDVIRSKTIGKVTSTTPSATYADGSYTVPAVLYCG